MFLASFVSDASAAKESACSTRDTGDKDLIPELGRSPGEERATTPVFFRIQATEASRLQSESDTIEHINSAQKQAVFNVS